MRERTTTRITSPDGVATVLESSGPPGAPGVIFIHGILHSRLIWQRQFADPALAGLRLAAYDVRGHGDADKPPEREYYNHSRRFADELKSVIEASGIARPLLVGWSLGSRILFNYLEFHGASGLAGVLIMGARMKAYAPGMPAPEGPLLRACSNDLATRLAARREFIAACHAVPPSADDLAQILASAMLMPPEVLRHFVGRPMDNEALLAGLTIPVAIIHGALDDVCPLAIAEAAIRLNPRIQFSPYAGIGHSPFFEAPARFNQDLLAFARRCAASYTNWRSY